MKKAVFVCLFIAVTVIIHAQSNSLRDQCRAIIYAVQPVDAISRVDDDTLRTLARFALGIPVQGQNQLNETDSFLFSWLANTEMMRRTNSPDAFSLFLQERREANEPYLRALDRYAIIINGWIDIFRLNLALRN